MSSVSRVKRSLCLLILGLSLSSLPGGCRMCIRPVLPIEPQPAMRSVEMWAPGNPAAEYCLTDRGRRDVLINLEMYRGSLESSRKTIRIYNKEVKETP